MKDLAEIKKVVLNADGEFTFEVKRILLGPDTGLSSVEFVIFSNGTHVLEHIVAMNISDYCATYRHNGVHTKKYIKAEHKCDIKPDAFKILHLLTSDTDNDVEILVEYDTYYISDDIALYNAYIDLINMLFEKFEEIL